MILIRGTILCFAIGISKKTSSYIGGIDPMNLKDNLAASSVDKEITEEVFNAKRLDTLPAGSQTACFILNLSNLANNFPIK